MSQNYLRNRPFLTITLIQTPRSGAKTEVKGWSKQDTNWEVLENPVVVDRINDKQLLNSNIIIDLLNKKIVKNGFSTNSDTDVLEHYFKKYATQIEETLQEWNRLNPQVETKAEDTIVTYTAV
jgi:hypothetical protein